MKIAYLATIAKIAYLATIALILQILYIYLSSLNVKIIIDMNVIINKNVLGISSKQVC
jgi:hypothetical protein